MDGYMIYEVLDTMLYGSHTPSYGMHYLLLWNIGICIISRGLGTMPWTPYPLIYGIIPFLEVLNPLIT